MTPFVAREAVSFGAAALAFLCGSIPFGLLLTRAAGLGDIRAIGSGSIGATNVLRTGRRGLAAATLLLDAAKGTGAVEVVRLLFGDVWMPLAAVAAVVGHCFTPWLGFRGGKGVATGLGVLLALDWRLAAACCLVWLAVAMVTRISSAGALATCAAAPVIGLVLLPAWWWVASACVAVLIVARHNGNIKRLLAGTEPRLGRRKAKPSADLS